MRQQFIDTFISTVWFYVLKWSVGWIEIGYSFCFYKKCCRVECQDIIITGDVFNFRESMDFFMIIIKNYDSHNSLVQPSVT